MLTMVIMYCFVNVPKIQIIKMKNKKRLLGNMCCAQTGCYHIFAYNKKRFQFRVDLHLVAIYNACAVLSYFLVKEAEFRCVVDFVVTMSAHIM